MECPYCERRCELTEGGFGFCRMYTLVDDVVRERFPHRWCAYAVSRLEAIPFYHVYPGSRCLVIGSASCNIDCRYCSNSYVAKEDPAGLQDIMIDIPPERLARLAVKHGCHSIVFSINEPTVSLPSLLELAVAAREAGLTMGCLTNGYGTPEAVELLGEIFSFVNVSLKGLSPDFCASYLGIPDSGPVVRAIRQLAGHCHVEVTTPVIESVNDQELPAMADILADIGPETPWHVFRLLPTYKMSKEHYPSIDALNAKLEDLRTRLPHIYFHNFIGSEWVDTHCPACGATVITRHSLGCGGDKLDQFLANGDKCPDCGRRLNLLGTKIAWNATEVRA
jgi:pyruvate formate lyase activating enzyme